MRRFKVTVYIDDKKKDGSGECAIAGMVDRVLGYEFRNNSDHGRSGGYVDCRLYGGSEVEEVQPEPCPHCKGKGVTFDGND